jgi:hypothetical protein
MRAAYTAARCKSVAAVLHVRWVAEMLTHNRHKLLDGHPLVGEDAPFPAFILDEIHPLILMTLDHFMYDYVDAGQPEVVGGNPWPARLQHLTQIGLDYTLVRAHW